MIAYKKDPQGVLDWAYNWSKWLEADETIVDHTVTAADGLDVDSSDGTDTRVIVWLSGGTLGTTYRVTCQVVTSKGRTDERSFDIMVRER